MDYIVIIVIVAVGLLVLYLRTVVKSTVEKSINHQFDVKLKEFEQSFTKELHSLDRKDKYQLAALDQRLEAHQKAYALARKMGHSIHSNTDEKLIFQKEFIEFWDSKCLYLEENVRNHFWESVNLYWAYYLYLKIWKDNPNDRTKGQLEDVFNKITTTQDVIANAVNLTALRDESSNIDSKGIVTPFGIEKKKKKVKK